jgi:hypothetical protein
MTDIFTVNTFLSGPFTLSLYYNTEAEAKAAFDKLAALKRGESEFEITVSDAYGTQAMVNRDEVNLIVLGNPVRICQAQTELALVNARAQAAANKRAASDPTMQLLNPNAPLLHMPRA